jgi:3-hydroxybutyryl-CoA dehydrogenase
VHSCTGEGRAAGPTETAAGAGDQSCAGAPIPIHLTPPIMPGSPPITRLRSRHRRPRIYQTFIRYGIVERVPSPPEPTAPDASSIASVAILGGGGLMGSGIAQVVARAGLDVTLIEADQDAVTRGLDRIARGYERVATRHPELAPDLEAAYSRISASTDLEGAGAAADHVIESVIEDYEAKTNLLRRLDRVCREEVVFATNTSQFSISSLGAGTGRPDRVIGSHWFNPPPVMKLIEIICGVETSEATLNLTTALARRYGKETVVCNKDTQGFITSRLIVMLMIEAARIVDEGIASVQDVNKACVLAFNHGQGPLDTADLSGLDTVHRVASSLVDHYGDRFRSPQNLRALVAAGCYGRKTGAGFSTYSDPI